MLNAIDFYRIGNWCYNKGIPCIPQITKYLNFLIFNSVVPYTAEIGEESKFAYGGIGCVVHSKAKIGKRVIIGQNTTIGRSLDPDNVPVIGDNVYISAGARIIGKVVVGDNVIIGANAVVTKDVPSNCITAGVPSRVVRMIDGDIYSMLKNIY